MLHWLCVILVFAACAPFLASYWPWAVDHAPGLLALVSLILLVPGFVAVLIARRNVEAAANAVPAPNASTKCAVCGSDAGAALCLGCGTLQPAAQAMSPARPLLLATLIVHRWPALLAFLAMVYLPGAYTVLRDAGQAEEERLQRDSEAARAFATAWSDFRGPLIAFGVQCGPRSLPVSPACDELVQKIATAYAHMSWYMPSVLAELRIRACPSPARRNDIAGRASSAACQLLSKHIYEDQGATSRSSKAFRDFMNAYPRYREEAQTSLQPSTSQMVGTAAATFYWETRKLGCALVFANFSALAPEQELGLSPFCTVYLRDHALSNPDWIDEADSLEWAEWFKLAPKPSARLAGSPMP